MNILGLVFSLLLILSYGFFACWEKQTGSARLRGTYLGHQKANRKILNHYESEIYKNLRSKKLSSTPDEEKKEEERLPNPALSKPQPNSECAKLNLLPLVLKGRENEPLLYEMAAKLLRTFYSASLFEGKGQLEYRFLNSLLLAIQAAQQKKIPLALEKLAFKEDAFQRLYYKMLKGMKEYDLSQSHGYPSLLDYIKLDPGEAKICLFHAHPDLLALFFGFKAAPKIFAEMHRENATSLTQEVIERLCSEAHSPLLDSSLYNLVEIGRPSHGRGGKRTLIEEDVETRVSLRKNVFLNENS